MRNDQRTEILGHDARVICTARDCAVCDARTAATIEANQRAIARARIVMVIGREWNAVDRLVAELGQRAAADMLAESGAPGSIGPRAVVSGRAWNARARLAASLGRLVDDDGNLR